VAARGCGASAAYRQRHRTRAQTTRSTSRDYAPLRRSSPRERTDPRSARGCPCRARSLRTTWPGCQLRTGPTSTRTVTLAPFDSLPRVVSRARAETRSASGSWPSGSPVRVLASGNSRCRGSPIACRASGRSRRPPDRAASSFLPSRRDPGSRSAPPPMTPPSLLGPDAAAPRTAESAPRIGWRERRPWPGHMPPGRRTRAAVTRDAWSLQWRLQPARSRRLSR
jgi:hypothetical protein